MKSLYVDGDSVFHRLSPGLKLVALMIISVALFIVQSPEFLGGTVIAALILTACSGLSLRLTWQRLRVALFSIVLFSLFTALFSGWLEAVAFFLRLLALALIASAVTATTRAGDLIETLTRAAQPLEKMDILRASDVGLSIGLVIRFVPDILSRYQAIRDAHLARGLKPKPLSLAVPLIILTLKQADEIASAIDARNVRGQNTKT